MPFCSNYVQGLSNSYTMGCPPVCSNFPVGLKMGPLGSQVLYRLIKGKHEDFFSETTRPRALIFGL